MWNELGQIDPALDFHGFLMSRHDKGICRESDGGHCDSPLFSVGNHPERARRFDGPKGKLLDLAGGAVFLEYFETIFSMGQILARVKPPELDRALRNAAKLFH